MLVNAFIALETGGHESPVIVGTTRNIFCTSLLNTTSIEWLQDGRRISTREDGGKTLILALNPNDTDFNGTKFTCRITTAKGLSFNETLTIQVRGMLS